MRTPTAEVTGGLASLKFITAALRRRAKFWCTTAAIGLIIGCGLYVASPPGYQASTSLWLTPGPYENVNTAANNDQAMAQSRAVAGLAVRKLGLRENAGSFLATYTVTGHHRTSDDYHGQCTVEQSGSAPGECCGRGVPPVPGGRDAGRADARARVAQPAGQPGQQHLSSINAQISQLSAQPASSAQQSQLSTCGRSVPRRPAHCPAFSKPPSEPDGHRPATAAAVKGSGCWMLPLRSPHSRLKPLVLYAAIGLIVGLVLGMAIVVIRALVSDRLRRRDDVAQALGAPVKLSVGTVRLNRRRPGRRGMLRAGDADIRRIAGHLRPGRARELPGRGHAGRHSCRRSAGRGRVPGVTGRVLRGAGQAGRRGRPVQRRPGSEASGRRGPGGLRGECGRRPLGRGGAGTRRRDTHRPARPWARCRLSAPPSPRRWPLPAPRPTFCSPWLPLTPRSAASTSPRGRPMPSPS